MVEKREVLEDLGPMTRETNYWFDGGKVPLQKKIVKEMSASTVSN